MSTQQHSEEQDATEPAEQPVSRRRETAGIVAICVLGFGAWGFAVYEGVRAFF